MITVVICSVSKEKAKVTHVGESIPTNVALWFASTAETLLFLNSKHYVFELILKHRLAVRKDPLLK